MKQNKEDSWKLQIKQLEQEVQYVRNNACNKEYDNNQAASNIQTQHSKAREWPPAISRSSKKCGNYKRDKLHRKCPLMTLENN